MATILVTGANRGIGRALVEEAVSRGARKVYAGMRTTAANTTERVVPVMLDITNPAQIRRAVDEVQSLDVLINNAGIALYDDLGDRLRKRVGEDVVLIALDSIEDRSGDGLRRRFGYVEASGHVGVDGTGQHGVHPHAAIGQKCAQ